MSDCHQSSYKTVNECQDKQEQRQVQKQSFIEKGTKAVWRQADAELVNKKLLFGW